MRITGTNKSRWAAS